MREFTYGFTVRAPLSAVAAFHHDTHALRRLTPPPVIVQLHRVEPLGEGSVSEFTMWFGPLPTRWTAIHSNVSQNGFTDTQAQGPLKRWQHTHRFTAQDDDTTRIDEHIEYEHERGLRGLLSRLAFARPALWFLFTYRQFVTRWSLRASRNLDPATPSPDRARDVSA